MVFFKPRLVVFVLLMVWGPPPSSSKETVDLEQCTEAGEVAGISAADVACETLLTYCPPPRRRKDALIPRNGGADYPRYLLEEVRRGTCVLLFQTACKQSILDAVLEDPNKWGCQHVIINGPEGVSADCQSKTDTKRIWDREVNAVCDQGVPPSRIELPPPVQFRPAPAGVDEEEVEAVDELVSEGRPTFQSTTAYGLSSSFAVDGSLNTTYGCTHTGFGGGKANEPTDNPWWSVDLGATRKITRIRVTNRGDCCGDRLDGFEIRVGSKSPLGDGTYNSPTRNRICDSGLSVPQGKTKEFPCDLQGRYVTIRLPGDARILTLCEVQVYAEVVEKLVISDEKILSKGKKTFQSSTLWNGVSSRAIDGNIDGVYNRKSCTHTGISPRKEFTANPWWAIDLGKSQKITAVRITTRSDCCYDRLNNFEIRIGDAKPEGNGGQNAICRSGLSIPRGETYEFSCPLKGRYVTIRIPGFRKVLTLCEVEILG